MRKLDDQPYIKIGDTVYWVHCTNRVYKGTVCEYSFCESQGAVYLHIHSPLFRKNTYPTVHYSFCFKNKDEAKEFAEDMQANGTFCKRCSRCEFDVMRLFGYLKRPEDKQEANT